jgi:hypothetical protein
MNPTDPAFPVEITQPGMDLLTYMAKGFVEAHIVREGLAGDASVLDWRADMAIKQADALIARLNAK